MDRADTREIRKLRNLLVAWATLGLGVLGCSHTHTQTPPEDPLHRTPTPTPVDPSTAPPPAPPATRTSAIPPIPTALTSTNNATLAAQSGLSGGRPLAIPERAANEPAPGQLTSTPRVPSGPPRVFEVPADSAAPGVQPASSWSSPAAVPVTPAVIVTTENFARLLSERGYTLQHLRQASLPQGVHVTCIAAYQNQAEQSVFEVTAADFDAAGQAILREAEGRVAAKRP